MASGQRWALCGRCLQQPQYAKSFPVTQWKKMSISQMHTILPRIHTCDTVKYLQ